MGVRGASSMLFLVLWLSCFKIRFPYSMTEILSDILLNLEVSQAAKLLISVELTFK